MYLKHSSRLQNQRVVVSEEHLAVARRLYLFYHSPIEWVDDMSQHIAFQHHAASWFNFLVDACHLCLDGHISLVFRLTKPSGHHYPHLLEQ